MPPGRKSVPKCVIKDCDRPQISRGLCDPCCQAARRLIRKSKGKLTWKKLEQQGLALPPSGIRSDSNPITVAVSEAGLINPTPTPK